MLQFDIIGDLNFDESFDCLSNGHYHWWIAGIFNVFKISAFLACIRFFPGLEKAFLKFVPKKMQDLQKEHYQAVVDKTQRRLKKGFERPDIMSHIMRNNGPGGMTIPEIESSMNVLCVGGSHNTSSTLSGITNYLVKNPACLQKLSNEVRAAHKSADEITIGSLSKLPYLSAVIEEGLRMAPPFPAGLPRCVPEGGDTVCGEWLPGGVNISPAPRFFLHVLTYSSNRHMCKSTRGPCSVSPLHLRCLASFCPSAGLQPIIPTRHLPTTIRLHLNNFL